MNPEIEDRDPELRAMLQEWKAPAFPEALDGRVLRPRQSWFQFFLRGYIRVPVPIAACLMLLLTLGAWKFTVQKPDSKACTQSARAAEVQPALPSAIACNNAVTGC